MKSNKNLQTCQIRISKKLRQAIKISAIKNKSNMEEMANFIIEAGLATLRK